MLGPLADASVEHEIRTAQATSVLFFASLVAGFASAFLRDRLRSATFFIRFLYRRFSLGLLTVGSLRDSIQHSSRRMCHCGVKGLSKPGAGGFGAVCMWSKPARLTCDTFAGFIRSNLKDAGSAEPRWGSNVAR